MRMVEEATSSRIRSARACGTSNKAYNIDDVVEQNLSNPGKEDYETLILAAPTVDISEITGSSNSVKEEKAINSSKKMIQISEKHFRNTPV